MADILDYTNTETEESLFGTCWQVRGCSRSDYMACAAFQRRKNCYELDRVVCCTKHRDNCPTCPVYIALNRVPVQRMRVRVATDRFDLEGTLCMPVGTRLSDFMNKPDKPFLALIDAHALTQESSRIVSEHQVTIVNKASIVLIQPCDEG